MITGNGTSHPYPGMSLLGVTAEPWPEGVVFRALTAGWATVDVREDIADDTHRLSAECTGEGCRWGTEPMASTTATYSGDLYELKLRSQGHAEECRAMRKPA